MMSGDMMPSGWDWASITLMMILPAVAVIGVILIVAILLLRNDRQAGPIQPASYSPSQAQPALATSNPTVQGIEQAVHNETIGKVVLSLAPTLADDERRVMDELAKAGGEMLQSSLPEMTGYTKATVSKAIHSLETRGIIVRERHKWTYWCKVNPRLIARIQKASS